MINKILKATILIAFLVSGIISCTSSPLNGILFTSSTTNVHDRNAGSVIGSANIVKSGRSCSWGIEFIISYIWYGGGASVQEAMENGGISKIAVIDHSNFSILGGYVFNNNCVVVYGE